MKKFMRFSEIKDKICTFYSKNKKMFFACIICFGLIIVLFVSSLTGLAKNKKSKQEKKQEVSVTSYATSVEEKLASIISKLDTISNVEVFVMVEATPTITYLTERKETTVTNSAGTTSEISTTVVFEKNGSISTPIVVTTIMPKVTGVLIVTNKIDYTTKLSIINSISIVLNVDESRISLLQER